MHYIDKSKILYCNIKSIQKLVEEVAVNMVEDTYESITCR